MATNDSAEDNHVWVFGYGSLTWKVDFEYADKMEGYITGYQRRFYQGSEDHRGVPGNPGRVVTLVEGEPTDVVWGVAYSLAPHHRDDTMAHLDYREKGGYVTKRLKVTPRDSSREPIEALVYIGTPENPHYLGHGPMEEIAAQIHRSVGPSGPNIDYALNLAKAMRTIAPDHHDEHLYELETHLHRLNSQSSQGQDSEGGNQTSP